MDLSSHFCSGQTPIKSRALYLNEDQKDLHAASKEAVFKLLPLSAWPYTVELQEAHSSLYSVFIAPSNCQQILTIFSQILEVRITPKSAKSREWKSKKKREAELMIIC